MKKNNESVMYVGPTLDGIATQNTVYSRIPDEAKEAKAKAPQFLNLFIKVRDYGMAERQLKTGKGYIALAYEEAWEKLRPRRKEA